MVKISPLANQTAVTNDGRGITCKLYGQQDIISVKPYVDSMLYVPVETENQNDVKAINKEYITGFTITYDPERDFIQLIGRVGTQIVAWWYFDSCLNYLWGGHTGGSTFDADEYGKPPYEHVDR